MTILFFYWTIRRCVPQCKKGLTSCIGSVKWSTTCSILKPPLKLSLKLAWTSLTSEVSNDGSVEYFRAFLTNRLGCSPKYQVYWRKGTIIEGLHMSVEQIIGNYFAKTLSCLTKRPCPTGSVHDKLSVSKCIHRKTRIFWSTNVIAAACWREQFSSKTPPTLDSHLTLSSDLALGLQFLLFLKQLPLTWVLPRFQSVLLQCNPCFWSPLLNCTHPNI